MVNPDLDHPNLKEHLAGLLALGRKGGYNWNEFMKI